LALINNIWVQVVDETWNEDVDSTSHPVEQGIPTTDTIRNKPIILSISGNIVDVGSKKAKTIVAELKKLKKEGSLITFVGRQTGNNLQIQTFQTNHPNTIWGGCEFEMELKEVKIAKKAYVAPKTTANTKTGELKVGSIVVFKGGSVYVSSDAKKPAATRKRSTCKITKIVNYSWSIHQYHLISTDGGRVYGWVDKKDIEGTGGTVTNSKSSGGTQQVTKKQSGSVVQKPNAGVAAYTDTGTGGDIKPKTTSEPYYGEAVYYTTKAGDSWSSIVKQYPNLNRPDNTEGSETWIRKKNPSAVNMTRGSNGKTYYTVKVGVKILVGYERVSGNAGGTRVAQVK
jgi:hypothetical protein